MVVDDWLKYVISGLALVISVVALFRSHRVDKRNRNNVARSTQLVNLPVLITDKYLQRLLTEPHRIGEDEYIKLKYLRNHVISSNSKENGTFNDLLKSFEEKSKVKGTAENKLAYELSLALDEVGMMLMTGTLPLIPTLQLAGLQFVEDYALSKPLIEKIRKSNETKYKANPKVSLHRVHAEWLSILAFEYFDRVFVGRKLGELSAIYPSKRERFVRLYKIEQSCKDLLADDTNSQVKKLLRL